MKRHPESHLDHRLTGDQINHIFERFAARDSFFIETFELPEPLGSVPCGLYGPMMGDAPIAEAEVSYGVRGSRAWKSRLVQRMGVRTTRLVTVIAGPHTEFRKDCRRCNGTGERFVSHGTVREIAWDAWAEAHCEYVGVVDSSMESKFEAWWQPYRVSCPCAVKHACILFTAFGGPPTPQEPGDPTCKDLEASTKFWSEHALVH